MLGKMIVCGLLAVGLAVSVSSGRADTITYNIIDYPAYETDFYNGATDTVSGTIITDGALGRLYATDIVGGSWTLTNPIIGTVTAPFSSVTILQHIVATSTTLSAPDGSLITLAFGDGVYGYDDDYLNAGGLYQSYFPIAPSSNTLYGFKYQSPHPVLNPVGDGVFAIVAVPEPGCLMLLVSALLGFGCLSALRRKRG
jgi:hypothetical protein